MAGSGQRFFPPVIWFGIKVFIVINFFILLRAAIPRPRYDQLMSLGWKILAAALTLVNILATGAWVLGVTRLNRNVKSA